MRLESVKDVIKDSSPMPSSELPCSLKEDAWYSSDCLSGIAEESAIARSLETGLQEPHPLLTTTTRKVFKDYGEIFRRLGRADLQL